MTKEKFFEMAERYLSVDSQAELFAMVKTVNYFGSKTPGAKKEVKEKTERVAATKKEKPYRSSINFNEQRNLFKNPEYLEMYLNAKK